MACQLKMMYCLKFLNEAVKVFKYLKYIDKLLPFFHIASLFPSTSVVSQRIKVVNKFIDTIRARVVRFVKDTYNSHYLNVISEV